MAYNNEARTPQQMSMQEGDGDEEEGTPNEGNENVMMMNQRFQQKRHQMDSLEPSPISQLRGQEYTDELTDDG